VWCDFWDIQHIYFARIKNYNKKWKTKIKNVIAFGYWINQVWIDSELIYSTQKPSSWVLTGFFPMTELDNTVKPTEIIAALLATGKTKEN